MNNDKNNESNAVKKNQENLDRTDPSTKKGYNEKNPTQPQGAFAPDSKETHDSVEEDMKESSDQDEIKK